jgi:hypothetical protein
VIKLIINKTSQNKKIKGHKTNKSENIIVKRELLLKMASVANILDANGLEAEANTITNIMVKIAAGETNAPSTDQPTEDKSKTKIPLRKEQKLQDFLTFESPQDRPGYDANQETDFQRILENYNRMHPQNKLYYFLKGFASEYYPGKNPANFANNFISWMMYKDGMSYKQFIPRQDLEYTNDINYFGLDKFQNPSGKIL